MGRVDTIGRILQADVHVGTPALRGVIDELALQARGELRVDLFRVDQRSVVDRLVELRDRGVDLHVLADTDAATGRLAARLQDAATSWRALGGDPIKQHAKVLGIDAGERAIVATDVADADAAHRIELAIDFRGSPARAVHAVQSAGSNAALRKALRAAVAEGVLLNDPRVAAMHATDGVDLLLAGSGPLRVVTKSFDAPGVAKQVASRAGAGGDAVELFTHSIPGAQRRLMQDVGVDVHVIDERDAERVSSALHGTAIFSGGDALVGSLYLEDRVLHGSAGRQSREAAVLLGGDAAVAARRAIDEALESTRSL